MTGVQTCALPIFGGEEALASPAALRLAAAIACQCFINEYVFAISGEEARAATRLRALLEQGVAELSTPNEDMRIRCLLLAMTQPLLDMEGGADLGRWGRDAWGEVLWPLIERTVCAPLVEAALAKETGKYQEIRDDHQHKLVPTRVCFEEF